MNDGISFVFGMGELRSTSVYTSTDATSPMMIFVTSNLTRSYDIIVKAYYNGKFVKAETETVSPGERQRRGRLPYIRRRDETHKTLGGYEQERP